MRVYYWPDLPGLQLRASPSAKTFLKFLSKKHPKIFALASSTIKKIEEEGNGLFSIDRKWVGSLKKVPLSELRIPPRNKGGVLRLYFCTDRRFHNSIIILDWQFKDDFEDEANTNLAHQRYRELKDAR